jgi:uncharacterized membrane protein
MPMEWHMTVTERAMAEVPAATAPAPAAPLARPRRRLSPAVLLALTAAAITASSIAAYRNGRSGIDLAIFDQGLWVAGHGLGHPGSIIRETLFEDHFAPGMLLFVALYKIVATPLWLLGAQGVAAWAAARLVANRLRASVGETWSTLAGVGLLLSPPIAYALLWDFHFVVIAVPLALAAAFSLEDGNPRRALLLGLAASLFRIEVGFAVLAAFAALPGDRRSRLRPAAVLLGYLLVAEYFEQKLGHAIFWPMHYGYLGTGPADAVRHPVRVLTSLFSGRSLHKALPWLATGGFACLLRPRLAIPAVLVALPVLFSHWGGTDTFIFQYGYAPTFLLALAWIPVARRPFGVRWVVAGSLGVAFLLGPVLPAVGYPAPGFSYALSRWVPDREIRCLTGGIPKSAGVSTTASALSRLAERDDAYLWPFPFEPAPANTLPGPQHRQPVPALAARVDYLVVSRSHTSPIPPGFTDDGATERFLRFRRTSTTTPSELRCT